MTKKHVYCDGSSISYMTRQRNLILSLKSGVLHTPFFMPDATRATVRGLSSEDIVSSGIEALVVNTYHLLLHPGSEYIQRFGGVHSFMRWDGPILSDSGGYQVYSLIHKHPERGKVDEEKVTFRSPREGNLYEITPEKSIAIQFALGVDMMVCLDDPRPNESPKEEIANAVERSIRWARRCKDEYERQIQKRNLSDDEKPLLFGVVQGGPYRDLRKRSVDELVNIGFDGYGFGARHIDERGVFMEDIIGYTASILPEEKPRFALGIGTPSDIVKCFRLGWDMFDCVIPTREGRHGRAFCFEKGENSWYKTLSVKNTCFREEKDPLEKGCDCPSCGGGYSLGYIHHLFRIGEMLGPRLVSLHNLRFYARLMEKLRKNDEDIW